MAGSSNDYFDGASAITMGGPRWRRDLTTATTAGYPDLCRVPKGAFVMGVLPTSNDLECQNEGIDGDTSRSDSLLTSTKSGTCKADKWSNFPVQPGQWVAIFGATISTGYEVAFYERGVEK